MDNPTPILPPHRTPVPALKAAVRHTVRSPIYLCRVAARIPRGLRAIFAPLLRWVRDEANVAAYQAALVASPGQYQKLREARDEMLAKRRAKLWLLAGVASLGIAVSEWFGHGWAWRAAAVALLVAAIAAGGKPSPHHTLAKETAPEKTKLPPAAIVDAFSVAIKSVENALKADPKALALIGPVHRDGPGWQATVELPLGVTIEDCVRARERLASALRVMADQLWLSPGRHSGQVVMWVADVRTVDMPEVAWSAASKSTISLTDPIPIGETAKGAPVSLSMRTRSPDGRTIAGGSLLVGGVSGSGKTTFMRLIVSAAAMDPSATIAIFDGKGDGDYKALLPVCDWVRVGASPDNLADLHTMLVEAQGVMERRQKGLEEKTPLLIVIDEVQRVKDKETQAVIEDLLRIGRSSGIFLVLVTQKPSAETLPTDLRDSVRTRVCLKVHSQATNDMVLGTGAYSDGRDATKFTTGLGLVLDVDTDSVDVVRVANVTDEIASRVAVSHARVPGRMFSNPVVEDDFVGVEAVGTAPALRLVPKVEAAHAQADPSGGLADHVRRVWPVDEDKMWTEELVALLDGRGGDVAAQLPKALGRSAKPVRKGGFVKRGFVYDEVFSDLSVT